ncbi:ATP-binding cassette domain-containing protein, partial [Desulfovibrio sp.]
MLSARKVRKRFRLREGEVLALKGLDLDVRENEFICIVGPSGCGKSTFLRMAAGLEPVSEGEILYRGQPVKTPRR